MKKSFSNRFNIPVTRSDLSYIYIQKISRYLLSKWNHYISKVCNICYERDTTEHMLFTRIREIWNTIGQIF